MINPRRIRALNNHAPGSGGVVMYWMNRDVRVHDNWALLYAAEKARERREPLLVVHNLVANFLGGGARQWDFKVRGLQGVVKTLATYNIHFALLQDYTGDPGVLAQEFADNFHPSLVVTDFSPLRVSQEWVGALAKSLTVPLLQVDTHNIVPAWVASDKQEFAAYTLRPKLHKLLPEFLEPFPKTLTHFSWAPVDQTKVNWEKILKLGGVDASVAPVERVAPGEAVAHKALKNFIENKLPAYADARNDPNADAQSGLSPYLHYGHLSPQRVALEVLKASGAKSIEELLSPTKNNAGAGASSAAAFLEELIVRRELADNFCLYNEHYDTPKGFPVWAQKTHAAHADDPREHIYTRAQFEHAKTHEPLWNAAQQELLQSGRTHGYMRMYWAKKILEWTPTVAAAMKIAIYLNDKYQLDGRDPNGYAGIAWSLGGVHDRAWFERPVFGQIRYMNANGAKTKFDTKAYIARWAPTE